MSRFEYIFEKHGDVLKTRKLAIGVIFHSDAGSQYTNDTYKKFLGKIM